MATLAIQKTIKQENPINYTDWIKHIRKESKKEYFKKRK